MSIINIYTGLCARHYSKYQCVYTHTHTYTLIQSSQQTFRLTTSILQMKKQRQIKVKFLSQADTQTIRREQGFKLRHHGFKIIILNYHIILTEQERKLQVLAYFTDCCILLKDHRRVTLFTFY